MEKVTLLHGSFSASHSDDECGPRAHGHSYRVTVAAGRSAAVRAELAAAIIEINRRPIAEVLPGVGVDPAGLAAWLLERLSFHGPVSRVTVWELDAGPDGLARGGEASTSEP